MESYQDEHEQSGHTRQTAAGFLAGVVIGGLVGAGTMLLLAPQSGKATRDQIRYKGQELRDQATETIEDTVAQARATGQLVSAGIQKQAEKIQQQGEVLRDQATETIEDTVAQARATGQLVSAGIQKRAEKIQQQGQDMLEEQKARWSPVIEAGQKAVQGTD